MKIYLANQSRFFAKHLEFLKRQPVIGYDATKLKEKTSVVTIHTDKDLKDLNTNFLFDYRIFPPYIMDFLTEWSYEKREMKTGDTIVQQAYIPPIRQFSQKIVFGVRINKIIREPARIGFSYETLKGHVEMGVSTFVIEQAEAGKIIFTIHTLSRPGNLLTKLLGPVFSVPYQAYCTRQGLAHVKKQLENSY